MSTSRPSALATSSRQGPPPRRGLRRHRLPSQGRHPPAHAPAVQHRLRAISLRIIDRLLQPDCQRLRRRLYGRTKPGTLLKHQIPIKAERWDVTRPGSAEADLVAHCGDAADGEYAHSLNCTDIATGWVETRAVLGRSQRAVCEALDEIVTALPFALEALDADNDSAFLNHHVVGYGQTHGIAFTRPR